MRAPGQIYEAGARNFVFFNIPPIQDSAGEVEWGTGDERARRARFVERFNYGLRHFVDDFHARHRDVTAVYFDANKLFCEVLERPDAFAATAGIRNTTGFCQGYSQ